MDDNLSELKRKRMVSLLKKIRKEHEDDDDMLAAIGEIENELTMKKYGLIWEQHIENVDIMMRDNIPVFTECPEKEIAAAPGKGYDFILEGDNLHSLRLLEKTHRNKIDLIYIDPPYNTLSGDFRYNDKRIGENDGYRHSKWLSFMSERLTMAKSLMSKTGCIFISINEKEFAQLKLLCDAVFGEGNFIGSLIWHKKSGGGQTDEFFVTEHEYVFGYRAGSRFRWIEHRLEVDPLSYKYEDERGRYNTSKLEKWGSDAHKRDRPSMYFPIKDPDGNDFYPVAPDGTPGRWRVGRERMDVLLANDGIQWKKSKGKWVPYEKTYYDPETAKGKLTKSRSILYDFAETGDATYMLTEIFGEKDVFKNPKPVDLIMFLMDHTHPKTVLDFFAGSGTTGHAVMMMNEEDGEDRRFILCTDNEDNICEEVTYERIRRVVEGYGDTPGLPANVMYYRTGFVPKDCDDVTAGLMEHISEMVQLEHGVKLDGREYILILSDEDADSLEADWEAHPDIKGLYISNSVLLTAEQRDLFEQVPVHTIPDYYFRFEMQEVGEAW